MFSPVNLLQTVLIFFPLHNIFVFIIIKNLVSFVVLIY